LGAEEELHNGLHSKGSTSVIFLLLAAMSCVPTPTCTATLTTDCATPTPVVTWSAATDDVGVVGYALYARETGTTQWTLNASMPGIQYFDEDAGSPLGPLWCQGVSVGVPLQRYFEMLPNVSYDIAVKAYDAEMNFSMDYSPSVTVCAPPIYPGRPAAYR